VIEVAEIITAVIGGGGVTAIGTYHATKRRLQTSTEALYMKQFDRQVARYLDEIKTKDDRIDRLYDRVDEASAKTDQARAECDEKIRELESRMREEFKREITKNGTRALVVEADE